MDWSYSIRPKKRPDSCYRVKSNPCGSEEETCECYVRLPSVIRHGPLIGMPTAAALN